MGIAARAIAGFLVLTLVVAPPIRRARAQAPTLPASPGSAPRPEGPGLGAPPGEGGRRDDAPGGPEGFLGGRPGPSIGRTPRQITRPGQPAAVTGRGRIELPRALPEASIPASIPLALPGGPASDGPPDGLTLDAAIDRLVHANLDLKGQFYEIPQAQADVLTAGLRANPIFYADSQLIPYGAYSDKRPGGPIQYDINVSYPIDVSGKRRARVASAVKVRRVLEAQYQDAVRLQIGNLYTAFVDVLAARETARFARRNLEGIEPIHTRAVEQARAGERSAIDVERFRIQRDTAAIGVTDADAGLEDARVGLAQLLNLPPDQAATLRVRGTIRDQAPPPPPLDALVRIALGCRPDVVAQRIGIGRAEADLTLARANRFEDVYLLYQPYTFQDLSPFQVKSAHSWALGVTVPLPVYNRNQGNVQRARLNVSQTQTELTALERRIVAEVQRASREYTTSKATVARIERDLLPHAARLVRELAALLPQGEVDVIEYLTAQREYNDVVRQYRDALVRHRRSMLDLNTAVGRRLLP